MSLHIGEERRTRALIPPEVSEREQRPNRVIQGVAVFAAATTTVSVVLTTIAIIHHDWRAALGASTMAIMATIAASLLVCHHMLADRLEFFRLGHLMGWMLGWRGQPPETGDVFWRT